MLADTLLKIGLTQNEIKVYLALLELGDTTTGPLIRSVGINSSKVYESLERLERKGLAGYVKKTNKRYFQATDPDRLMDFLDEKKKRLDEEKQEIAQMLPKMRQLMTKSADEQQEATIYKGLKGYRTLLESMLQELQGKGSYMAFASGMLKQVLGPYWHVFQKKKKQYMISSRCLWDPKVRTQKGYLKEYVGTGRFLSKGSYRSPVDMFIFNDKVILISYTSKPVFAVLITSKGMAQSYRDLFETIWASAKAA